MTSEPNNTKRHRSSHYQLLQAARGGDLLACRTAWADIPNQRYYQESLQMYDRGAERVWNTDATESPLHLAVYHGHGDIVRLFVQEFGIPVNQIDYVETPLGVACHQDHVDICRMLLAELGADPDLGGGTSGECDDGVICPLWAAARHGSTEIVSLLIQHGARIDFNSFDATKSARGYEEREWAYPSEIAIQRNDIEMAKVFIQHNADFPDFPGSNPAVDFEDCTDAMMVFLVSILNEKDRKPITTYLIALIGTLFDRASEGYESPQLSSFFNAGLQYSVLSQRLHDYDNCISPIHLVSESGRHTFGEKLLQAGANANKKDENGCTPLHLASSADNLEMCRVLLQYGANVNETDNNGWSALQRTLYYCRHTSDSWYGELRKNTIDICDLLLSSGADMLIEEGESHSAFRMCASFDDDRLIKMFLSIWDSRFDGNNHGRNDDGDLPIHVAVTNPNITLPSLFVLFKHSCKAVSLPDGESGWLPLHLACMWGADLDVIFLILRQYPSAVDKNVVSELMFQASH